jgi:ribosomal protein S18 acetylase RimI-like enzyme
LPGKYAEPDGKILLASSNDNVVGGVAMRPLDEKGVCEMKRLFVREKYRGEGIGRKLTSQIIEISRRAGYAKMRLDTERRLEIAINLYRKFGFIEINQYYNNPLEDILYMEIQLT